MLLNSIGIGIVLNNNELIIFVIPEQKRHSIDFFFRNSGHNKLFISINNIYTIDRIESISLYFFRHLFNLQILSIYDSHMTIETHDNIILVKHFYNINREPQSNFFYQQRILIFPQKNIFIQTSRGNYLISFNQANIRYQILVSTDFIHSLTLLVIDFDAVRIFLFCFDLTDVNTINT